MLTRDSRILVGQGREEIHPLCNHGIIGNIFRHLDVKALKAVRETCTFWNEEASALLQDRAKITITWYSEVDKKKKPTLPTFMKYMESVKPENVFFRNYELFDWCLHSKEEEMTQFWLKCGEHVRNLTLKDSFFGFYEQSYVQNVFYNWTPNMESLQIENVRFLNDPNYKPLSLVKKTRRVHHVDEDGSYSEEETDSDTESDDVDVSTLDPIEKCKIRENIQPNYNFHTFSMDPSYEYPNFPLQWKEMFISYPNMRSLSVHAVFHNEGIDNVKELLKDLIEFQEENPDKLQNLKHLDVFSPLSNTSISNVLPTLYALYFRDDEGDCAVTNKHFEQAMKLKFKLESLRIYFDEVRELSYDVVGKYIAKLSPTLKTLEITCGEQALTIFPPLGKKISFPKLEDISIELNALSSNNVDFLEKTPALETLTIGDLPGSANEPRLFFNTITMLQLDSLHYLHLGEDILTEDCVRKIGEWFSNLSHFGAILDDKLLWAVYKFLNNSVEELDIKGKKLTDAGITGMEIMEASDDNSDSSTSEPKPSSSKRSESEEPPVKRHKFNESEDRTYIGASIGQMKKLRHVVIGISYSPDPDSSDTERVQLTDDSVYNGFILLTELTYLELSLCEESITEEAYRDLCSRRNIMTLDTTHFYRGYEIEKTGMLRGQSFTKIEI